MAEFRIPQGTLTTRRHDQWMVALASIGAVLLGFSILLFIAYGPRSVVHRVGPMLVWVLVLIVVFDVAMVFFALRRTFERVRHELTFVLNENELARKRPGFPDVRIPLSQIVSVYEQSDCLVVAGGEPLRRIAVPKTVENFAFLQAKLMKYAAPAHPPRRSNRGWVKFVLTIICWSLLICSRNRSITLISGGGVLVLLGWWSFELRHRLLHGSKRIALWILVGSSWLLAGLVIYIRVFWGRL